MIIAPAVARVFSMESAYLRVAATRSPPAAPRMETTIVRMLQFDHAERLGKLLSSTGAIFHTQYTIHNTYIHTYIHREIERLRDYYVINTSTHVLK